MIIVLVLFSEFERHSIKRGRVLYNLIDGCAQILLRSHYLIQQIVLLVLRAGHLVLLLPLRYGLLKVNEMLDQHFVIM